MSLILVGPWGVHNVKTGRFLLVLKVLIGR